MTSTANHAFDAHPNVLAGETAPNTLSGVGPPAAAQRAALAPRALLITAAGAVVGVVALLLALVRTA